jgi:tRNA threonylcarbamoyladenosine biosynthesis protein TsaE
LTRSSLQLESHSEQQTVELAAALSACLEGGEIIALEGPLGSGKTCFVRGVAQGLGINPAQVSSPTFVICHEYMADQPASVSEQAETSDANSRISTLIHIDAYRIAGSTDELETLGWTELLESNEREGTIIAIEWPSRIADEMKKLPRRIDVAIEHIDEHSRRLTIAAAFEIMQRLRSVIVPASNPESRQAAAAGLATKIQHPKADFKCRTCGRPVAEAAPTFPFCSKRCKLADLGQWFSEGYRVSRPTESESEEAGQ